MPEEYKSLSEKLEQIEIEHSILLKHKNCYETAQPLSSQFKASLEKDGLDYTHLCNMPEECTFKEKEGHLTFCTFEQHLEKFSAKVDDYNADINSRFVPTTFTGWN